jgi:hypothetical protein
MRWGFKTAAMAAIVGVVLVTGASYAYLSFNARRIFNTQISSLTQRHVEARVVRAGFPASLLVEGLSIDGLLTCDRARASVDILSLWGRDFRIHTLELVHPVLTWERMPSKPSQTLSSKPAQAKGSSYKNVILAQLLVHDGVLKVVTKNDAGSVREYTVDQVQVRARNVALTDTPARTDFFVTASLVKLNVPFVGHFLKTNGWLNWAAKDMDAMAQVMDDNGKIGLDAKIFSRQNDMTVSGDVVFASGQEPQATGKKTGLVENALLNVMLSTNTDIAMSFSFKTKMDDVDIAKVSLSGHMTTGLNSSATSGNIVAGLKAAGEELLKTSEDMEDQK